MSTEVSSEVPAAEPARISSEDIRRQMRVRFDAFNEAVANRRQISRDASALRDAAETKRWASHDVDVDVDANANAKVGADASAKADAADMSELNENDSIGG